MLDINYIRENSDAVKKAAHDKNIDVDIDRVLDLDRERREAKTKLDDLRRKKNEIAESMKDEARRTPDLIEQGKEVKDKIRNLEEKLRLTEQEYADLMHMIPLVPSSDTPVGRDDSENVEVARHGELPAFDFAPKDHVSLGESLDILDLDKGSAVGGYRGYYLKNEGVLLHMGIMMFALKKLISKGFTPMIPPTLVKSFALLGSGHFPFGRDEIYQVANPGKLADGSKEDHLYLVGTAEPSLLAYFANETLEEKDLPIKVCGFSQCYRSEVGSYGKDTRGVYRVHEFMKIEQVIITPADIDQSLKSLEELRAISEEILSDLGLPYRVIQICTGDMGAGKYKMYDIETWMPSREKYGETHSDSNLLDWQSRRLNIRYRDKEGGKRHVYMLNNTAAASPRLLIAVLENFQQKDGSVAVPGVLQDFVGTDILKPKDKNGFSQKTETLSKAKTSDPGKKS